MTSPSDNPLLPAPMDQARIDRDLDRALRTLSFAFDMHSTSREPVVLRSVELAMFLRELGYGRDVQVAGVLHDLLKYTRYPLHDIAHDFGDEVSVLIMANTLDPAIEDDTERHEEAFTRCIAWGESAAAIMAGALLQETIPGAKTLEPLNPRAARPVQSAVAGAATVGPSVAELAKMRRFLELSKPVIGHESIWKRLYDRVEVLTRAGAQNKDDPS